MADWLPGVASIVLIDLVLSGDNALVIGMACAKLPPQQRRVGILLGSLAAIGMRILLAAGAAFLMQVPLLSAAGGLLLAYIAYKLAAGTGDGHDSVGSGADLWAAIKTVAMADLVMSLDNVLAVGGVSRGNLHLLVFGLALTIPIIMWGSGLVARLLERAPWLTYAGALVLAWTAADMLVADPMLSLPPSYVWPLLLAVLVLGSAMWHRRSRPLL